VFTARYGLSPYIKQIRFVFKGLSMKNNKHKERNEFHSVRCSINLNVAVESWLYVPGVDSVSNKNKYEEYLRGGGGGKGGRCIRLKTLPPSCADFLEILGASTSWNPEGPSKRVLGVFYPSKIKNTEMGEGCSRFKIRKSGGYVSTVKGPEGMGKFRWSGRILLKWKVKLFLLMP
jgi:hypothetical protein